MFKSADAALRWAFQVMATDIVKLSSINRMRGCDGAAEMSPHDRHAQAAMIMQMIERTIDPVGMAYVMARYGRELQGGEHATAVAVALSTAVIGTFSTGMHNRRGVIRMIEVYFGADYTMKSLQLGLGGCSNRRYYEYKDGINKALDHIHLRALDAVHRAMDDSGLIIKDEAA